MEFENLDTDGIKVRAADSGGDSDLTLAVLPGVEGAESWKHQYRYFKSNFRTLLIDPEDRSKQSYRDSAEAVLDSKNITNCVLIGANLSCFVVDLLKDSGRVVSSVFTDSRKQTYEIDERKFKALKFASRHPKIINKLFFSEKTDYQTVKEFRNDIDWMDWKEVETYQDSEITGGAANALLIKPEKGSYASKDIQSVLEPDLSISSISSGSFCFYERPEEYNKALYDFVSKLKDFQKKAKVREKRENNRSLADYENKESSYSRKKVKRK